MSNYVELVGYITGDVIRSELQVGTVICQWRMRVARDESGSDSIPCVTSATRIMKFLEKQPKNGQISITGELRSRYWQVSGKVQSRLEVEVNGATKMK